MRACVHVYLYVREKERKRESTSFRERSFLVSHASTVDWRVITERFVILDRTHVSIDRSLSPKIRRHSLKRRAGDRSNLQSILN